MNIDGGRPAPLSGQRPTASFIKGSWRSRSRSLVAVGDRRSTRHHHFEHRVSHPIRFAAIGHRVRKTPAHTELAPASRTSSRPPLEDWLPPLKSTVSFLRQTAGRSKGKQRIVGHGGCGARLMREALCQSNDLLRESAASWPQSPQNFLSPDE
jgi:hypothetical protein